MGQCGKQEARLGTHEPWRRISPTKSCMMVGKVVRNILKVEFTGFANRLLVGVRETGSKDEAQFIGLRTRQKVLSLNETGRDAGEHLERTGASGVPGEQCLVSRP